MQAAGRKVARHLRIEVEIRALVRFELAGQIPLVESRTRQGWRRTPRRAFTPKCAGPASYVAWRAPTPEVDLQDFSARKVEFVQIT